MAKTLVIKGANFSTNKLDTVVFERIHTTALSIEETASLTALGGTHQIEYTITPSDSEDPILWESSNETVCTVDSDGVITAVGCGTATITATSNSISDTCTVTCAIDMDVIRSKKLYISSQSSSGHTTNADCYQGTTQTSYNIYMSMVDTDDTKTALNIPLQYAAQDSETGKYYIPDESYWQSYDPTYRLYTKVGYIIPIKLPANCTSIKCVALNEHYAPYVMFYKSNTRASSDDTNQGYFSAYKNASPTPNNYSWSYQEETTVTVASGYDSVSVMWKADTAGGAVDFANLTDEQIAQFKIICS